MNSADGQHSPSSMRRIVRGSYLVSRASCFWAIVDAYCKIDAE